ncbi:MAG: MarR family winged helix-turn-helix transcriptional regulator [Eubacteriales bacterium]|nr:MarR family winged helix-turn-helix transcriptional regulator [Eubacteriales bacterium]
MNKSIARMINLMARKSQICIGNALCKYNLTAAEQPFFMALQKYEGITQEELTAIVCVDKAATARVVKSLERKGYLIRVQDEKDRRQNRIYPAGVTRQMGETVRNELLSFDKLLTKGIPQEDLDVTYTVLLKMKENLTGIQNEKSVGSDQGGKEDEANK